MRSRRSCTEYCRCGDRNVSTASRFLRWYPFGNGVGMSGNEFLTQLAKRCRRLARSSFDLGVAGELREMAHELESKASEAPPKRQVREPGAPAPQRASQRTRRNE